MAFQLESLPASSQGEGPRESARVGLADEDSLLSVKPDIYYLFCWF